MNRRGQSFIEFFCLLALFIAAMVVMSAYIKRGIQGNWHANAASIYPDMYDRTGSSSTSVSGRINSEFVGFSQGGAGWVMDGNVWLLWR